MKDILNNLVYERITRQTIRDGEWSLVAAFRTESKACLFAAGERDRWAKAMVVADTCPTILAEVRVAYASGDEYTFSITPQQAKHEQQSERTRLNDLAVRSGSGVTGK